MEQIADGRRPGNGQYTLTSENYWQACSVELEPHLEKLFETYATNLLARDLLIEVASVARSAVLLERILADVGNDYAKVLSDTPVLDYLLAVGSQRQLGKLCAAALRAKSLDGTATRHLIEACAWRSLTGNDLVVLVKKLIAEDDAESYRLKWSLTGDVAARADAGDLLHLSEALLEVVVAELVDDDADLPSALEKVNWMAETVSDNLAQLIDRQPPPDGSAVKRIAELVARLQLEVLDREGGGANFRRLTSTLEASGKVRLAVVRHLVKATTSLDDNQFFSKIFLGAQVVRPTLEEARKVGAKRLATMLIDVETRAKQHVVTERPKANRTSSTAIAATKKQLSGRRKNIESGKDIGALSWVAQILASTSSHARYGEVTLGEFRASYGDALAGVVERGLREHWRNREPRRDEASPNTTYWSTVAGIQGLHLELGNGDSAAKLSQGVVERALDYGLYEINGLPKWYWSVAAAHPEVAIPAIRETLKNGHRGAVSAEHAAKILTALGDAPSAIGAALAPDAWSALNNGALNDYQTSSVLAMLVRSAAVPMPDFRKAATRTVFEKPLTSKAATWALHWLLYDSEEFILQVTRRSNKDAGTSDLLIAKLAEQLEGGHGGGVLDTLRTRAEAVMALKWLYVELRRIFPREQDKIHPPGKVYTIDERERAQGFRDRLPSLLASIRNRTAYLALIDLSSIAEGETEKRYLLWLARQVAEDLLRRTKPMDEAEYVHFEHTLRPEPDSLEAFAQEVENDIGDIRDIVQSGEFSPRRFLATSVQDMASKRVKAMEDEFQLYLAGQMEIVGRGRYSVFREPQLAEDTRRDISVSRSASGWKITVELKVTEGGWTVTDYRDALRNQLVGLYMRARHTTVGFFVVLRQSFREWTFGGNRVGFDQLLQLLREDALTIEGEHPTLRLRVIGIDATEPARSDGQPVRAKARSRLPGSGTAKSRVASKKAAPPVQKGITKRRPRLLPEKK